VINAIEAMEEEQGVLEINLMKPADGFASLAIRDNGCGIPEDQLSRLFEPYFTRKKNGVGLGLASTLNILQAHKVELEVNSIERQGTTFTITFPLADRHPDASAAIAGQTNDI
jgi:signal transduction histidine kinase